MNRRFSGFLFILFLTSCTNFSRYASQYNFNSSDKAPHYENLDYWAAHPWKKDLSDSIPAPLRQEKRDTVADVFFLHPTIYTDGNMGGNQNALIDDKKLNAKTDYTTILYQASVFNQHSRVFAPRYRQAHVSNFFIRDTVLSNAAFDTAYVDLKNAFDHYLQNWNKGRPIIIASHSQGSKHAKRLLKEYFEGKKLKRQLVVAYVIGWPVPVNYFTDLKFCEDSLETGCICGWRTFKKGYIPFYIKNEKNPSRVTNPLTWQTNEEYAPASLHKGSVFREFNQVLPQTTDAQIANGVLWVARPDFPGSVFYLSRNYHIGDINLFYVNLRENVEQRIESYQMRNKK